MVLGSLLLFISFQITCRKVFQSISSNGTARKRLQFETIVKTKICDLVTNKQLGLGVLRLQVFSFRVSRATSSYQNVANILIHPAFKKSQNIFSKRLSKKQKCGSHKIL